MQRIEFKTVYGDGVQNYFTVEAADIDAGFVLATYQSTRRTGARPDIARIEFVQVLNFDILDEARRQERREERGLGLVHAAHRGHLRDEERSATRKASA